MEDPEHFLQELNQSVNAEDDEHQRILDALKDIKSAR
jgi:hypothetical protein